MYNHRKAFSELEFTDDFMFCKILTDNKDLCRELLELILEIRIRKIEFSDSQKEFKNTYDAKGIRLDVYVEDDNNTVYDIEMQTTVRRDLAKRIRVYQGMIDLNLIGTNQHYSKLKETYIIFICLEDPFEKNLPVYHFRNVCLEDASVEMPDGAHRVILNAGGSREGLSDEMAAFLDYLKDRKTDSAFTERLQKQVEQAITRKQWEGEYMTLEMKLMDLEMEYREELEKQVAQVIAEKDAEMNNAITEKDNTIAEKDSTIAALKAQLAAYQADQNK